MDAAVGRSRRCSNRSSIPSCAGRRPSATTSTKASPPVLQEPPAVPIAIDDTPTEPATSPRHADPSAQEWPVDLQLPAREYGPQEEPERYATRFIVNEGQWTPEEHEQVLRKAAQAVNVKYWIVKLEKKLREPIENMLKVWQIGEPELKLWVSKHIQLQFLKVFPLCELFRMSMKLFVNMTLPLRHRHPTFTSKESPSNNEQRDAFRVLQSRRASKDWLPSFQDLLQPLQPSTSSTYLSPSSTRSRVLESSDIEASATSTSSTGFLPTSKCVTRHFQQNSKSVL